MGMMDGKAVLVTGAARENEYKATALRLGGEWFWSPVMTGHNYHLIHHLYPGAPFYNYRRIFALKRDDILAQEPLMPPTWGLNRSLQAGNDL